MGRARSIAATTPPSNTPALSQPRSSFDIADRLPALDLSDQGIRVDLVEAASMSASSTHTLPRQLTVVLIVSRAWWATSPGQTRSWSEEVELRRSARPRPSLPPSPPYRPHKECRVAATDPADPAWECERAATAAAGRSRRAASRQASSRRSPTPRATTSSMVIPSTPGAPRLARTSPSLSEHVAAGDLAIRGVETAIPVPGSHSGRARVGEHEPGPRSLGVAYGPSRYGTHHSPSAPSGASMKYGPFPMWPAFPTSEYYDPLRLPLDHPMPPPGSPVIGRASLPSPAGDRGRDGSPEFPGRPFARSTPLYAGGFLSARSWNERAFRGLRPARTGSAPSLPRPKAGLFDDASPGLHSRCRPHD